MYYINIENDKPIAMNKRIAWTYLGITIVSLQYMSVNNSYLSSQLKCIQ